MRVRGRWIVSFVSSCYLGLEQDQRIARAVARVAADWGVMFPTPRILGCDAATQQLERGLAEIAGMPAARLFQSTTHLALDALPLLAGSFGAILLDSWSYPTSLAGAREAQRKGALLVRFAHNDVNHLEQLLRKFRARGRKIIVCDGIYSAGAGHARLREFASLAARWGALCYVDDSHGLAVLGRPSGPAHPYGQGAGGLIRWLDIPTDRILLVASLSKSLGVPGAFLAGPSGLLRQMTLQADSFVHSSPPSLINMAAAGEALRLLIVEGDARRHLLASLVIRFLNGLRRLALPCFSNHLFPILTLPFDSTPEAIARASFLRRAGVWPAFQSAPPDYPPGAVLRFFVTSSHTASDVDRALAALEFN